MGACAPLFLAAVLACGRADAPERVPPARPKAESGRKLDLAPAKALLSASGLRIPLGDASFLSLDARLVEWRAYPAVPETAKLSLHAGVAVGVEF